MKKKKNLLDLKFKPINTNNNSLTKTKTDKNDKTLKRPSFPNPNRNITHNRLFNTLGIQTKKTNIKLNLIVNEKTLFQNYKFNKRNNNKPIRKINSTFSHNNNITLFNNINPNKIYFINKNAKNLKIISLNMSNNQNRTHNNSINNLNLKNNIIYRPIFKRNLKIDII